MRRVWDKVWSVDWAQVGIANINTLLTQKADKNKALQTNLYAQYAQDVQAPNLSITPEILFNNPPLDNMALLDHRALGYNKAGRPAGAPPMSSSMFANHFETLTFNLYHNRALQVATQCYMGEDNGRIFLRTRHRDNNDYGYAQWQAWQRIATAAPPKRFEIPYAAGFGRWIWDGLNIESYYCKTQESIVIGSIACEKPDKTDIKCCDQIAVLPVGFRPKDHLFVPGIFRGVDHYYKGSGAMTIGANGLIQCHYSTDGCNKFVASFCFLAE